MEERLVLTVYHLELNIGPGGLDGVKSLGARIALALIINYV